MTGGGRGIGAAIATALAGAGATLAVLDVDRDAATETVGRCEALGAIARPFRCDVGSEVSVGRAAAQVAEELGPAALLVNNAGVLSKIGPSMDLRLDDWEESITVMATGAFLCSREFGEQMRSGGGGSIVNVSSINGLLAFPLRLAYSAAKAALLSMTEVLAVEWAGYGIRVNAVAPGCTRTAMLDAAIHEGAIESEAYLGHVPMRRWGEPGEIAAAVIFLASDQASFVTGQTIAVDGGWTSFGWIPWSGDPEAPRPGDRPA